MANLPVDRDPNYMYQMWGTTNLITDYNVNPKNKHFLKEQAEMHERIRNDEDYDDWEYGTEPIYGKPQ
jgi:hypothetical protein